MSFGIMQNISTENESLKCQMSINAGEAYIKNNQLIFLLSRIWRDYALRNSFCLFVCLVSRYTDTVKVMWRLKRLMGRWEMLHFLLSLMRRLNKTESAIFISIVWFGCLEGSTFTRILITYKCNRCWYWWLILNVA